MNWLAHLRLAPATPALVRLGNLAGDFVRGIDLAALHPELQRGVSMHRAVDRFVDAHRVVGRARERLRPALGRFSGVALDVFFDHFLARDWARHGDGGALTAFVDAVHGQLDAHEALLPEELRHAYPRMLQHRWLTIYATLEGIDEVLRAMARRRPRAAVLATAGEHLQRHYGAFEADFEALWPELVAFVAAHPTGSRPDRDHR